VHYHQPHRPGGRAEHFDFPDHDGDGEDAGHCGADVNGGTAIAGATHLYFSGCADRGCRYGFGAGARIRAVVGRGALQAGVALARGVLDRLRSVRRARRGWNRGSAGRARHIAGGDDLSVVVGVEGVAGGSAEVRVAASGPSVIPREGESPVFLRVVILSAKARVPLRVVTRARAKARVEGPCVSYEHHSELLLRIVIPSEGESPSRGTLRFVCP